MKGRNLKELEGAINFVKRNGFEITLANELIEANKILFQVITIQILQKKYPSYKYDRSKNDDQ